jgi:hypothetical protein
VESARSGRGTVIVAAGTGATVEPAVRAGPLTGVDALARTAAALDSTARTGRGTRMDARAGSSARVESAPGAGGVLTRARGARHARGRPGRARTGPAFGLGR